MIEEKLEIVIPTYNRADYLDKTLSYLLKSPLNGCKITVRDNASPDNTPEICEKYSKLFKNMCIIRNEKNIGGNANIFRSYEKATYPYVWVLADNDYLNFDKCDDFIEAVESDKYDVIICCSALYTSEDSPNTFPTPEDEPISEYIKRNKGNDKNYLENTAQELASIIQVHYFLIGGFISSTIYRTSIIDTEVLIQGYNYVSKSYPHFVLVAKSLNNNLLTYKTKNDIVFLKPNPTEYEATFLNVYSGYLNCVTLIKNKQLQSYALQHYGNILYSTTSHLIFAKTHNDPSLKENLFSLIKAIYLLKGWCKGFLYQNYIILCYFIPNSIWKYFLNIKNKIR